MWNPNPKFLQKGPSGPLQTDPKIIWERIRAQIEKITDPVGTPIDEGIKEMIVSLQVLGINTGASCEGHANIDEFGQRPWPWVLIQAPAEPPERFVGQRAALEKAAEEHSMTVEELERSKLYWDVLKQISDNPLTPEYEAWESENQKLRELVSQLLGEFYQNRKVAEDIKLKTDEGLYPHYGEFELASVVDRGVILRFLNKELTAEEWKELLEKLPRRQNEMRDFSVFLKKKFLS